MGDVLNVSSAYERRFWVTFKTSLQRLRVNNDNYAHMFYECQKCIGIESNNMITADSFPKGRSVFCFNFVNEVAEDSLPIERSANLRLSLTLDNNLTSLHVVILLADTKGIISIDNQRIVTCDVRG